MPSGGTSVALLAKVSDDPSVSPLACNSVAMSHKTASGRWLIFVALFTFWFWPASARLAAKREPQDYGGPPAPTVGPALLWAPRVVLFPPWLVSEYVLRQPVGALTRAAEREQWPAQVVS